MLKTRRMHTFITGDENSLKKLSRKYQCARKMFAVILGTGSVTIVRIRNYKG